jgi:hypothetical protein
MQFVISCNVGSGVGGDLLKHVKSPQFVTSYNDYIHVVGCKMLIEVQDKNDLLPPHLPS